MTIKQALGTEAYEQVRAVIVRAFPDTRNVVSDDVVDAFLREVQRQALPGTEKLGFPKLPEAAEPPGSSSSATYPLYVAHATHARVLAMGSTTPFQSSFVGQLPTVRVPLPVSLNYLNTSVSTQIGTVDFASDHLAGSVDLMSRLYSATLGYAPARVDLITPAREYGSRFGASAIYLGYRNASDTSPSFYVLEAGLATGQAAMLYLGETMDTTIVQASGYQPTPFSSPDNTYTGNLLVQNDQPVELVVQANAPGLPHYIQVSIRYEPVAANPGTLPICITVGAIERVAAIGEAMGVPIGMPAVIEGVLAEIALLCLSWVVKPGQTPPAIAVAKAGPPVNPLAVRLTALARELVTTYQPTSATAGVATVSGKSVKLSKATRDKIAALVDTATVGAVPASASTLAPLLGAVDTSPGHPDLFALPSGAAVSAAITALALGSGADASFTGTGTRQTWVNQIANQQVQPLSIFAPVSLHATSDPQSLEAVLTAALAGRSAVRAIGSGHSYSDVGTTPDFLIDTHGLCKIASPATPITGQLSSAELQTKLPLANGPVTWSAYAPETNLALVEMEAGITIRALNTALEAWNLGLRNMGGYDGQTIVGAISTSTHGSGIGLGPFPDMVRSLVLVTTGKWQGKTVGGATPTNGIYIYRIEPSKGITDPAKYTDPLVQLIQDDDCFRAAICNMGCFGVIYSVVLEVMQMYWLSETRSLTTLDKVIASLAPNPANPGSVPDVLLNTRNYEVLIQPYPVKDFALVTMDPTAPPSTYYPYFTCLVTQRNIAPKPEVPHGHTPMPDWLGTLLSLLLNAEPAFIPAALDISLLTLVDNNAVDTSFDIYNLGLGGGVGFAAEIGFSLEDGTGAYTAAGFQSAIDRIHAIAQRARVQGNQYQTSPFSLRFVKASDAHLSMMQGQNTAMIEMDMLTGTYAGAEIMYRYETSMYSLGGRPHWGLEFDSLTGSNGLIAAMYPKLAAWQAVYAQFNALGTFDNAFTQRMGFTALR